jgi:hypothetical protein
MNFWVICVLLIFFKKNQQNAHNYPDIREDLSEKISGYSISDMYQTYFTRIRNIRIPIRYPKKSGYPKISSESVFIIFESGSRRIFSEPYYILLSPTHNKPQPQQSYQYYTRIALHGSENQ